MSAPEERTEPATPRLAIDAAGLSDAEVAAITTVVLAAASGGAAAGAPARSAAWRRAGLAEAATGRRIRTLTQLERAPVR